MARSTNRSAKVLLCDAAFSALPILFSLRRKGFQTAVCGARPGDPGHALADASFAIDYSDADALCRLVRSNAIDFLVPGCTDVSYLSCAQVAKELGLPGYDSPEATAAIHRKDAFRAFCREKGFPIPQFTSSSSDLGTLRFPVLIKPADSFSGKGIVKVDSKSEVEAAMREATAYSAARSVVIEEFVAGDLCSHSAFIRNGKVLEDFFVNEFCTVNPYQVNSSHVSFDIGDHLMASIRECVEELVSALTLSDGLIHTQFIYCGNRFYLIEITRRCPGDLYATLVDKSLNVEYAAFYSAPFCGENYPERNHARPRRFYSRHTVSTSRECVFLSCGLTLARAEISFVPLKRSGERLRPAPTDRAGIYFIKHFSASEMRQRTPRLREYVSIQAEACDV